jgi:xanthine dehydrogenase/oxidase
MLLPIQAGEEGNIRPIHGGSRPFHTKVCRTITRRALQIGLYFKAGIAVLKDNDVQIPAGEDISRRSKVGHVGGLVEALRTTRRKDYKAPVARPYVKSTALAQCSGQTHYTHELAYPQETLHAAFVQSKRALADFFFTLPDDGTPIDADKLNQHLVDRYPAFRRLITCDDIPLGGSQFSRNGPRPTFVRNHRQAE